MAAVAIGENYGPEDLIPLTGADLSAARGKALEAGSTLGTFTVTNGTSDLVAAICVTNAPSSSTTAFASGVSPGCGKRVLLKAGGTVAIGDRVGTHSDGTFVAKTADADLIVGQALTAASSGEFFTCQLGTGLQRAS